MFLLLRKFCRDKGDCFGYAGFCAVSAAGTFCNINDAVLGISSAGRADIETQALFGTETEISYGKLLHFSGLHNFELPVRSTADRTF